jgi:hypothetical protein
MNNDFHAVIKFLTSTWGILTSLTILFPGAATLLSAGIAVEHSEISKFYTIIPTIFAVLTLFILVHIRNNIKSASNIAKTAIKLGFLAFIFLLSFLFIRQTYLNVDNVTFERDLSGNRIQTKIDHGIINREVRDPESGRVIESTIESQSIDLLNLSIFTIAFSMITASFSIVGIKEFMMSKNEPIIHGKMGE